MLQELMGRQAVLSDRELLRRRKENREYLMSLKSENLLLSYRFEAGLYGANTLPEGIHGGWESPLCQLRGHFLGHWLSAAAMNYQATGDIELKAKADAIIAALGECQQANGGEWVGSIPEKYLDLIARGRGVWAPQYTLHKTFMGLLDMYQLAGNRQALEIAVNFSKWFERWSAQFTQEEFDRILNIETGGMLEIWASLYEITKESRYRTLMNRYYRRCLFDGLLEGKDVLTNMHANTTIPEALGAAKAYEATGEQKWRDIVEAYWDCAVTQRGQFATGGQTSGEIWTPKMELSARLGDKNQEHCTVYNMMRLAGVLFRWTGEAKYADYWEQNLYNGIMAQGYWRGYFTHGLKSNHPTSGLLSYFLPLRAGGVKGWSSETNDFYCCHGTLVQANAAHNRGIYYTSGEDFYICQYFDSTGQADICGNPVTFTQKIDALTGSCHLSSTSSGSHEMNGITAQVPHDPHRLADYITIETEKSVEFTLKLRNPWWAKGDAEIFINGEKYPYQKDEKGFCSIQKIWQNQDQILLVLPRGITCCALPDDPQKAAFLYGPILLAGLCDSERRLTVEDIKHPEGILVADNEREWGNWMNTYRTTGQKENIRFVPLHTVGYDPYTIYFPLTTHS